MQKVLLIKIKHSRKLNISSFKGVEANQVGSTDGWLVRSLVHYYVDVLRCFPPSDSFPFPFRNKWLVARATLL